VNTSAANGTGGCTVAECTLTEAIAAAQSGGGGIVAFDIDEALPVVIATHASVTGSVTIDGTTQPGYAGSPVIEIDGGITVGYCGRLVVRGLSLTSEFGDGITVECGYLVAEDNYIGLRPDGVTGDGGSNGIFFFDVDPDGGEIRRNVISGNREWGIYSFLGSYPEAIVIEDNLIGTDASGTMAVPNGEGGVRLGEDSAVVTGNVISGNHGTGLHVFSAVDVQVSGNVIGADATGTAPLANTGDGIFADNAAIIRMTIDGNVIGGNGGDGIHILRSDDDLLVVDNWIGTNADDTDLGNAGAGIRVEEESVGVVIGDSPSQANSIAFNAGNGVEVVGGNTTDIAVRFNHIFNNGGIGIDLRADGVTANDNRDIDGGPNGQQNFPVTSAAVASAGRTAVSFELRSTPNTTFVIDAYSVGVCDLSGNGEARLYLSNRVVTTNAQGRVSATRTFRAADVGDFVTLTATNPGGSTSELSACVAVTST
jgi:hypothetical protein